MKRIILTLLSLAAYCCSYAAVNADSLGVYAVNGDDVRRIELKKYTSTRISAGLFHAKAKLTFPGKTSPHQFHNGKAVLRFYFRELSEYEAVKYHAFNPISTPGDFVIVKMKSRGNERRMTTVSIAPFVGRTGAQGDSGLQVETKELREGVYEMTITGPSGEYCVAYSANGTAGYNGIFDFTIADSPNDNNEYEL